MSNLLERARLLPANHARRVVITFLVKWFTENELFNLGGEGDAVPEPQPIDYESGAAEIRTGEPVLAIRGAFGSHDTADVVRSIVVQRRSHRDNRSVIGNQHGEVVVQHKDAYVRAKRYTAHEHVPVTAWCMSMEAEEAETIAAFVYHAFQFWRIEGRKDYPGLRDIVDLQHGEATAIERVGATHQVVGVPVTLVLDIQYEWLIFRKDASPLRSIITQIETGPECVQFVDGGDIPWPSS